MALSPALGNKEQCEDASGEFPLPVLLPRNGRGGYSGEGKGYLT